MTLNYTTIAWATAALLVLSLAAFAAHRVHASPGGFGPHHGYGHGFKPHRLIKMIHHLDLTRDQREQIGSIMDEQRPKMRGFMLDMMDAKTALQDILKRENYDAAAVETLVTSQAANAESMFVDAGAAFAKIAAVLTPEQRQQVAESLERRGRWGAKHGDSRGNGEHRLPPGRD